MKFLALSALLALAFAADASVDAGCAKTKADVVAKKDEASKHRPEFLDKWREEKKDNKGDLVKDEARAKFIKEREVRWNSLSEEEKQKFIAKRKEYAEKHKADHKADDKADDKKNVGKVVVKGLRLDKDAKDGKEEHGRKFDENWVADQKAWAADKKNHKDDNKDGQKDHADNRDHKFDVKAAKADKVDKKDHEDNRDHKDRKSVV